LAGRVDEVKEKSKRSFKSARSRDESSQGSDLAISSQNRLPNWLPRYVVLQAQSLRGFTRKAMRRKVAKKQKWANYSSEKQVTQRKLPGGTKQRGRKYGIYERKQMTEREERWN